MKKNILPFALLLLSFGWHASHAQWTSLGTGISATSSKSIFSISAVDENIIWAVGWDEITQTSLLKFTRTTNGGSSWITGDLDIPPEYLTQHIFALDELTAWLAVVTLGNPLTGRIYKTTDGGETWVYQNTAYPSSLPAAIHMFDENEGVTFGGFNYAPSTTPFKGYVTSNGGDTWEEVGLPTPLPGEKIQIENGNNLYAAFGDIIWVATTKNRVFKSKDRGHTWTPYSIDLSPQAKFSGPNSIAFKDSLNGIVVAYDPPEASRTTDGGITWSKIAGFPTQIQSVQIEFIPGTKGTYVIHDGFGFDSPNLLVSYNDGTNWEIFPTNLTMETIEFLSPRIGFGGGSFIVPSEGGMYKWSSAGLGNRLFVNDDANGANNGSSWADAFTDLQSALAIAQEGDQVWVAEGTYKPAAAGGSETATFLIDKNLQLYGGFAGTEVSLSERGDPAGHPTILSGDLNGDDVEDDFVQNRGDNVLHVMRMTANISNDAAIDGFFLKGGHADGTNYPSSNGGAIWSQGSPTIRNCIFTNNFCYDLGGAISFAAATDTARIEDCEFAKNKGNMGGAIDARFSNISINDCVFSDNQAKNEGATALEENGGAIFTQNTNCTLLNCSFSGNENNSGGGGFFWWIDNNGDGFELKVDSCHFEDNTAKTGAAMYVNVWGKNSDVAITNTQFVKNTVTESWATLAVYRSNLVEGGNTLIDNCLFEENTSVLGSAAIDIGSFVGAVSSNSSITNCIFKNNIVPSWAGAVSIFGDFNSKAKFLLEKCRFEGNKAGLRGGALWVITSSDEFQADVNHCEFVNNESPSGAAIAVFEYTLSTVAIPDSATLKIDNCLFAGNKGSEAVISLDSFPGLHLLNCTVAENQAGGIQLADKSGLTLQNTILYNPGFPEYTAGTADVTFTSLGGNLIHDLSLDGKLIASDQQNADPLFAAPGDYHLTHASPAVDAGVNDGVTAATDLDGNPRIQGSGVDAGAFESPFDTPTKEVAATALLAVSPNPATDFLRIELPENVGGAFEVQVLDAQGRLLRSRSLAAGQQFDLQGLAAGIYTLKVMEGERFYVGKFVKQ